MARKGRFRSRLRYWFDNTMSRGTPALVGWLVIVTAVLILAITAGLAWAEPPAKASPLNLLWETFISAFSLSGIPGAGETPLAVLALWFVLAIGGIFIVSALIGLLTSGLNNKLE